MQLHDDERQYKIQDAAALIKDLPIKGKFSQETAKLLRDQIEGMYDYEDLRYVVS